MQFPIITADSDKQREYAENEARRLETAIPKWFEAAHRLAANVAEDTREYAAILAGELNAMRERIAEVVPTDAGEFLDFVVCAFGDTHLTEEHCVHQRLYDLAVYNTRADRPIIEGLPEEDTRNWEPERPAARFDNRPAVKYVLYGGERP